MPSSFAPRDVNLELDLFVNLMCESLHLLLDRLERTFEIGEGSERRQVVDLGGQIRGGLPPDAAPCPPIMPGPSNTPVATGQMRGAGFWNPTGGDGSLRGSITASARFRLRRAWPAARPA
ncbi:hypothetical protein ACFVYA_31160 [Amycolatopsis sp. NPDC058278]|uniref:hypothetical protein n=1 Tax=Amycolatopsis sp. NPDC058278 TaxID=3346417 RepID=UPI0036DD9415